MQVFKTDKKLFRTNELKSWLLTFAFAALLFFAFKLFLSAKNESIIAGVGCMLLLKLGDTLIQYHIVEIQIDNQKKPADFYTK